MPSSQIQIIESAKLTYSPLVKAFEKQTKTVEDQGRKQVHALKTLKPKELEALSSDLLYLTINLMIMRSFQNIKTFFLSNERIGKIYNISKEIDFKNLVYYFKNKDITPINFIGFRGPMHIYNNIKKW